MQIDLFPLLAVPFTASAAVSFCTCHLSLLLPWAIYYVDGMKQRMGHLPSSGFVVLIFPFAPTYIPLFCCFPLAFPVSVLFLLARFRFAFFLLFLASIWLKFCNFELIPATTKPLSPLSPP